MPTRKEFHALARKRPIFLDGSTGSELVKRGLPAGACPEQWVIENPDAIRDLHSKYTAAGSDIILACTFGANRIKLADHGLSHAVDEMNEQLVRISRPAVGKAWLFGDMSPTGRIVEPFGDLPFEEAVDVFRQQAAALLRAGVDGFMIETMLDIQEARAALIAVRSLAPDIPVLTSLTYDKDGKTLTGGGPDSAIVTLQALGADAVGSNCSTGPEEMLKLAQTALPYSRVPMLAKPNAGVPVMVDGKVRYNLEPDAFATSLIKFVNAGARVVGGCCGTSPEHITEAINRIKALSPVPALPDPAFSLPSVSSARKVVSFAGKTDPRPPMRVIGERINPTGKKAFQAELLSGDLSGVRRFADEQLAAGADLLDVNLGLGGIDEVDYLRQAVVLLANANPLPLVIDSVNPKAMEAALRIYPGRALVNSVSGEHDRIEKLLPIAAKYGAMLIVLPVAEGFIPNTPDERVTVTKDVMTAVAKHGYSADDVVVDGLAMTISSDPEAALNSIEFIRRLTEEHGLRTMIGLSNISFGMPERGLINAHFLSMAAAAGLGAVIANPSVESLMSAKDAANALLGRRDGIGSFITLHGGKKDGPASGAAPAKVATPTSPADHAAECVIKGDVKRVAAAVQAALDSGVPADELVEKYLVTAIVKAGDLFEKKEYYLPQLMLAGEAMRLAMEVAEPALEKARAGEARVGRGTIIFATVKGDVHDIGKNLVVLMLRNHGFNVVDLGKDVSPERIIKEALKPEVRVVGLSALMTTTLAAMKDAVAAIKAAGLKAHIMVGGAAVTEGYAREIGANGFSTDAVSAVKLAEKLASDGNGNFIAETN